MLWSFLRQPPPAPPPPPPALLNTTTLAILILTVLTLVVLAVLRRAIHHNRCRILHRGGNAQPLAPIECLKDGFASRKVPDAVDVLVIGSGVSGLMVAALLSKLGYKCVVLEQHDQAGGSTHTFDEGGFEFDTGLHYVGDILGILLNAGTTGTIEWALTGDVVDEVVCGEERVPIKHPRASYLNELHARFPKERVAINRYSRELDRAKLALGSRLVLKLLPRWMHSRLLPIVRVLLPLPSTLHVLESLTADSKLINLLSYVWGTYGLPPSRAPFAMNAIIQTHYFNGAYYPVCSHLPLRVRVRV